MERPHTQNHVGADLGAGGGGSRSGRGRVGPNGRGSSRVPQLMLVPSAPLRATLHHVSRLGAYTIQPARGRAHDAVLIVDAFTKWKPVLLLRTLRAR